MKSRKILKIVGIVIGIICALFLVFVLALRIYFRAPVHNYYKISKKAFVIPGIKNGYIAQGISYDSETDNFFLSGYMHDHSASPIYVVNKTSRKTVKSVKLTNADGSAFTNHSGGLSVLGDLVYVAGGAQECLFVFNKSDILNAENGSSVKYTDIVNLKDSDDGIGIAFTTVHDNLIIAGEFYREGPYPTRDSHKVSTSDGFNKALAIGFKVEGNTPVPEIVYSLPANIQGMCFTNDSLYLSESWGVSFSHIYKFNLSDLKQNETFTVLGKELPLYVLEKNNLAETYKIAPMSEELEYVDRRIYISNESASKKYKFGKFTGGKWCYAAKF